MVTNDLTELALSIAKVASETEDPHTARQLVDLIYDLLTEAGLPVVCSELDAASCPSH